MTESRDRQSPGKKDQASATPMLEFKEKLLREELRAVRESSLRTMQWGVTLLVTLQTALFFVRQEVLRRYIEVNHLPHDSGASLPFPMHLIGTAFLLMIAFIVQQTVSTTAARYVDYLKQLNTMNRPSGITELPPRMAMRWFVRCLFYAFPAFDVLLRLFVKVSAEFHIM